MRRSHLNGSTFSTTRTGSIGGGSQGGDAGGCRRTATVAWLVLACLFACAPVAGAPGATRVEDDLRPLLEDIRFSGIDLSQDGRWVAYLMTRPSLDSNGYRHSVVLRRADGSGAAQTLAETGSVAGASPDGYMRWSPVDDRLAFRLADSPLQIYDARTQARRPVEIPANGERIFGDLANAGLQWSPDGGRIAFAAPEPAPAPPAPEEGNRGFEVDQYWDPVRAPGSLQTPPYRPARLWVLELGDGRLKRASADPLDVTDYRWAPDSRRLVVAATDTPEAGRFGLDTDLYVIDAETAQATPLVRQRGFDSLPAWSPDGRWVAFASQLPYTSEARPRNLRFEATVAVVAADGSAPPHDVLAARRDRPDIPVELRALSWSPDSRAIRFQGGAELRGAWFEVDLQGQRVRRSTPHEPLADFPFCDQAAGRMACVRRTPTAPDQVVVRDGESDAWRVLDAGSGTPFAGLTSEIVRWRSADDRWDIHGILIRPPGFDPARRYPLVVYLAGGPAMVRARYGLAFDHPLLAWANRGFLVLAPNTRGRAGYGPDFSAAIASERSDLIVPHGDVVSGVQALVDRGLADPDRVGLTGFSYGFALGLETIAQSDRFKAASLTDGTVESVTGSFMHAALGWHAEVLRDQNGAGSVFDPQALQILQRESPLFRLHRVKTPLLAEFGSTHIQAATQGRMLLHALRARDVPVELIVYPRTDHGIVEPLLRLDSMRRNIEWFDYWLLGKASERMRVRYGPRAVSRKPGPK